MLQSKALAGSSLHQADQEGQAKACEKEGLSCETLQEQRRAIQGVS